MTNTSFATIIVIIVDEHTGRLMYGRRFSDGLHQAIEAKEKVTVQQESRTLATISIQNYFRMYNKLAGMTGTAATEAEEFRHIYNMDVLVVPTNKPVIRDDRDDIVYKTQAAKYGAIAAETERVHGTGRPILIGTRSIEHNQVISNFLKRKGVDHKVLNAKNNEKEAFIIADAGKKNAITVATNIAGRGVDIVLGGAKPELKDYRLAEDDRPEEAPDVPDNVTIPPSVNPRNYNLEAYSTALSEWKTDHDEVIDLGGLHIVGTERHESRRIDNQLRGRAGRQGDPGSSQFFVSLEDDIMRIFGGEQIAQIMDFLKVDEHQPIEHGMIGKSIESAQVKVETFFFDQRKRLVQFDDVMNKQREIIYERRRRLLDVSTAETELIDTESDESRAVDHDSISKAEERRLEQAADVAEASRSLKEQILGYVRDEVATVVMLRAPESFTEEEYDAIIKEFSKIIPFDDRSQKELQKKIDDIVDPFEIEETLFEIAKETYEQKEKSIGDEQMRQLERAVMLSTIDQKWMDHIDEMQNLRDGIWLRGDKQTVLSEYKKEGFAMFEALVDNIESSIASKVYRIQIQKQPQPVVDLSKVKERKDNINESLDKEVQDATPPTPEQAGVPRNTQGSSSDMAAALGGSRRSAAKRASKSIGRNDQCPCGSGLKYKECGLIEAAEHQA